MSPNVEKLHEQMSSMSLGDLLLLAGQAVNMGMDEKRLDLILTYVQIALTDRRMNLKIKNG